jgi:hypothetical protein
VGLLTILLLGGSVELVSRRLLVRFPYVGENCLTVIDAAVGSQGIPNCVVTEKISEGVVTEYKFNRNGYRDNADFTPKAAGIYRIVLVGSSIAAGFRVPEEQTITTLLPAELSKRTGRKVEVYSEGLPWRSPRNTAHDLKDAIAVNPNMILWIISPLDVGDPAKVPQKDADDFLKSQNKTWRVIQTAFATESFQEAVATLFSHTWSGKLLRDLLFNSPSRYVQSSLMGTDYQKDFLRSQPGPEWSRQLAEFDESAAEIAGQTKEAGIPLVAVLVPDRAQVAMVSMMDERPKDFDPYKLGNELRTILESHGGIYLDIVPDFRTVPNPQLGWFATDGHPNARGHAMIADFLTAKLANVMVPAR